MAEFSFFTLPPQESSFGQAQERQSSHTRFHLLVGPGSTQKEVQLILHEQHKNNVFSFDFCASSIFLNTKIVKSRLDSTGGLTFFMSRNIRIYKVAMR